MTKKEFKEALLRGQGRCIQAAQAQPERYRSVIMWACARETAYDLQCEGSRAWFVYRLIKCFSDHTPFLDTLIEKLDREGDSERTDYPAEVLYFFMRDGEKRAEDTLWRKYEERRRKAARKPDMRKTYSGSEAFARICWLLAEKKSAAIRIAEDIGNLYRNNHCHAIDFDWLYDGRMKKYLPALTCQTGKSDNVAEYLRVSQEWEAEEEEIRKKSKEIWPREGFGFSRWLKKYGSSEEILRYAEEYLEQSDLKARAKALSVFSRCPFPGDPSPVLEDAASDFEPLRNAAWTALENIRHPQVREFVLPHLEDHFEDAWPVFFANYQPRDAELAIELVKGVPVEESESGPYWHSIQTEVLSADGHGIKLPAEMLRHIYETTRCACCRYDAVRQMGRRRLLTDEILRECLFDSYRHTRAYAKRRLSQRSR